MMDAYSSEALSSQRSYHPQRPHLSVPTNMHAQPNSIGYNSAPIPSLPPPQSQLPRSLPRHEQTMGLRVPTGPGRNSFMGRSEGKIYELEVVQQPVRARMCGFGDKDRRPITPPPCVRLVIRDERTGQEVNLNEFDTSFFVLTVDLWDEVCEEEQNLVRNPGGSPNPAISASIPLTYPQSDMAPTQQTPGGYFPNGSNGYGNSVNDSRYGPPSASSHYTPAPLYGGPPPSSYGAQGTNGYGYNHGYQPTSPYQTSPMTPGGHYPPSMAAAPMPRDYAGAGSSGSSGPPVYNRNLIGSLSASAFVLTDTEGKTGIWFVLQDLSVRQEGNFTLKMSFVDVGNMTPTGPNAALSHNPAIPSNGLKTTAPVLAWTFSKSFQVYSAKKFPGVIESTALSKCFATQGIKIPIRQNDGGNRRGHHSDDEDDDGE